MAAFSTILAAVGLGLGAAKAVSDISSAKKAEKTAKASAAADAAARAKAEREAKSAQRKASMDLAAANKKIPDIEAIISRSRQGSAAQPSSLLTAAGGVDPNAIGRSTLLGG